MTLLTKKEAEQFVKNASSVAKSPATMKDVQAAVAGNKDVIVPLLKRLERCDDR